VLDRIDEELVMENDRDQIFVQQISLDFLVDAAEVCTWSYWISESVTASY
jgi:hypothetical protein